MQLMTTLAAAMLAAAGADSAPTASGAMEFVEALYRPYRAEPTQMVEALKRREDYFEAGLVRAIKADDADAAKRGEVPLLSGDPICDCQDYIPFQAAIAPVKLDGSRAETTVRFNNGYARELKVQLIATPGGWRIYDIITPDYSLRGLYKL